MRPALSALIALALVALAHATRPQTYKIVFQEKMKPEELAQRVTIEIVDPSDGNKYTCIIPEAPAVSEEVPPSPPPEAPSDATSVLSALAGSFYQQEGWWTYEFAFGSHIRQFHQEKDAVLAEYFLGRGPPRSAPSTPDYYAELYSGGTLCDLTQQPRTTEVQYRCNPEQVIPILNIKEAATCQYVVTVFTSLLCKHPYYKPRQDDSVPIVCIKPPHVNKYFIGQPVAFN